MSVEKAVGVALIVAALGFSSRVSAQGSESKNEPKPRAAASATVGVQDLDGRPADLARLVADKPSLLIFWATWCPNCRAQMPEFKATWERYHSKGLNVVTVNIGGKDSREAIKQYLKKNAIPYPVYYDDRQNASQSYRIAATPEILLLNRSGEVVYRASAIDSAAIDALLAGKPVPQPVPPKHDEPAGSTTRGSGSRF